MSCRARFTSGADEENGSALIVVLLGTTLLLALTTAAILLASSDILAASRQQDARIAFSAAEAALERAASDLIDTPDWNLVLSGAITSSRVDGPSSASHVPFGGPALTPDQVANLATCGTIGACSTSACSAVTAERPWGPNNPRWRPYAYGPVDSATPGQAATYVVVLVGDDPSENDGDPERDGVSPGNPGAGIVLLRAEAFGPSDTRRVVEAAIARVTVATGVALPRVLSWAAVR
jgi:type II secretory pathway pseudopilin PulG